MQLIRRTDGPESEIAERVVGTGKTDSRRYNKPDASKKNSTSSKLKHHLMRTSLEWLVGK